MKTLSIFSTLLIIGSFIYGQGLTNNGAYIKVASGAYLKVSGISGNFNNKTGSQIGLVEINGNMQVAGNLNLFPKSRLTINGSGSVSGNLNIYADATGTGSLLDYSNLTIAGTTNAQLFLPLSSRYYYVSSPVTGATAAAFGDIATTDKLYYRNTAASAWVRITNPLATIQPLTGYATQQDANNVNITLSGTINTGVKSPGIINSGDSWNLIGNPYPSAMDYGSDNFPVSGWTRTNLRNTIYVKHGPVFATWNTAGDGTGSNDGSRYIQANQAFWVKATGAAVLSMNNNVRVHQGTSLLKEAPFCYQLRLKLSSSSISDEAIVRFHEDADEDFDKFDAEKFLVTDLNVPQIWSVLGTEKMTINTYTEIPERKVVELGHNTGGKGDFNITFSELETFPPQAVIYLHDKLMNKYVDVRQNPVYAFYSESMKEVNRFELVFSNGLVRFNPYDDKPLSLDNAAKDIKIFSADKSVIIKSNVNLDATVKIYNIIGNEISNFQMKGSFYQVDLEVSSGYYFVKLIDNKTIITQKVHIR